MTRLARRTTRLMGVLGIVLTLGATAACSGSGAEWNSPGDGTQTSAPPDEAQLSVSPAHEAKNVSPADPVTVTIANGTLTTVVVTNPDNKVVKGEFSADRSSWTTTEELGYNKTYTIKATGNALDGKTLEETRTFSTVKPGNYTLPYLRANVATLLDGGTFGVGQPIVVWFDEPIKDRAEAERSMAVTTDPPGIVGGWRWLNNRELHWRPKEYWPSGTRVTIEANVYGKHFGGGLYGQEDRKASFTIGKKKYAVADSKTHRMKVYIDDVQVTKINGKDVTAGIPISMGKGGKEVGANGVVVDYTTNSGPHVITTKHEVYRMTSASFGITDPDSPNFYDEKIKKSIRISGDGEFVHLRDWSTWQLGKANTSHGCINVGVEYIYWFYDNFGAGDIVDVTGTARKLDWRNGLGDWVLSWAEWQKGSALYNPDAPTPTATSTPTATATP